MSEKWAEIEEGIFYEKGQIAQINFGEYTLRFKVKKPFKLNCLFEHKIVVTIPVTLDTLRGLGFISKVKSNAT